LINLFFEIKNFVPRFHQSGIELLQFTLDRRTAFLDLILGNEYVGLEQHDRLTDRNSA